MEKERLLVPILIVLILLGIVLVFVFSGDNTFKTGNVSFQYPSSWSQDHTVGNFNNTEIYSEVTLTKEVAADNTTQTAYIVLQMQKRTEGVLQLPSASALTGNTTNSSISTVDVAGFKASQLANFGPQVSKKITIIKTSDFYYTIEYVTPTAALNDTAAAYNTILQSLTII
ncbi:hypothetical protein [Methanobacterium aggregans]|uniref:hypothetical protein n=1 Tax=Methanobacterium aggregans TaxID=1615586 RepID=UPI00320CD926